MNKEDRILFDDLFRFQFAAERYLESKNEKKTKKHDFSLKSTAKALGISSPTLTASFDRLKERYKKILFETHIGSKSSTFLTEEGESFLKFLQMLHDETIHSLYANKSDNKSNRNVLRLSMSRSVISTDLLYPSIQNIIDDYRRHNDIEIDFSDSYEYASAIERVEHGKIDMTISFRLQDDSYHDSKASHLLIEDDFSPDFDVVIVSGKDHLIETMVHDGSIDQLLYTKMATSSVLTVNRVLEPYSIRAMQPRGSGQRKSIGSIDLVLTQVRVGLADYGVVPAIYSLIDRMKQFGSLYYSDKIATAKLVFVTRKSSAESPHVTKFKSEISHLISNLKTTSVPKSKFAPYGRLLSLNNKRSGKLGLFGLYFPKDQEWYRKIEYGYYVDHNRDSNGKAIANSKASWRHERIKVICSKVQPGENGLSDNIVFNGIIVNGLGAKFDMVSESYGNFLISTCRQSDGIYSCHSVQEFRSVFVWCDHEECLLFGTWRGINDDGIVVPYSTVWSGKPLNINELQAITAYASRSFGLTSNSTCKDFNSEISL